MNKIIDSTNRQIITSEQKDFFKKHILKNTTYLSVWGK